MACMSLYVSLASVRIRQSIVQCDLNNVADVHTKTHLSDITCSSVVSLTRLPSLKLYQSHVMVYSTAQHIMWHQERIRPSHGDYAWLMSALLKFCRRNIRTSAAGIMNVALVSLHVSLSSSPLISSTVSGGEACFISTFLQLSIHIHMRTMTERGRHTHTSTVN